MASYSFTADNKVVFNKFDKPFDAVRRTTAVSARCTRS